MVLQEEQKLKEAFEPQQTFAELEPPKWSKNQLIDMMQMLVDEPLGIVKVHARKWRR